MKAPDPQNWARVAVLLAIQTLFLGHFLTPPALAEGHTLVVDPIPPTNRPPLAARLAATSTGLRVAWSGTGILLSAPALDATWTGISMRSPYTIEPSDSQRFYRAISAVRPVEILVPAGYNPNVPAPLIISLHGYRHEAAFQENLIPFKQLAEELGFIYCVPRGVVNDFGAVHWNGADCCGMTDPSRDDVAFLAGLITAASEHLSVDPKRVFIVGHSNGGHMAYRFACERADLAAAIVSLAGATYHDPTKCVPTEPVSVLQIHGTEDEIVNYAGGFIPPDIPRPGALETIAHWAAYNGCETLVEDPEMIMDLDLSVPGLDTTVSRYLDGPPGIGVELWTIHGGTHYPVATQGEASSELAGRIVEWLLAHPKTN